MVVEGGGEEGSREGEWGAAEWGCVSRVEEEEGAESRSTHCARGEPACAFDSEAAHETLYAISRAYGARNTRA